jgi:hypothetical protein
VETIKLYSSGKLTVLRKKMLENTNMILSSMTRKNLRVIKKVLKMGLNLVQMQVMRKRAKEKTLEFFRWKK